MWWLVSSLLCFVFTCVLYYMYLVFFFFKQKTAYEMRISDWSSDVCSSDRSRRSTLRPGTGSHPAASVTPERPLQHVGDTLVRCLILARHGAEIAAALLNRKRVV